MATARLKVKFRAPGGAAGSPAAMLSGEIAYNMADGLFYVGYGDDGSGNATSAKIFARDNYGAGGGGTYSAGAGIAIDGAGAISADGTIARLASPVFTGTPTAPTPAGGDDSTKLATTAFVNSRIAALVGGAAAAYDTLVEIQALIEADDAGFAALTATVAGKLAKASNLSDLTDVAAARTNLGLAVIDGGTF